MAGRSLLASARARESARHRRAGIEMWTRVPRRGSIPSYPVRRKGSNARVVVPFDERSHSEPARGGLRMTREEEFKLSHHQCPLQTNAGSRSVSSADHAAFRISRSRSCLPSRNTTPIGLRFVVRRSRTRADRGWFASRSCTQSLEGTAPGGWRFAADARRFSPTAAPLGRSQVRRHGKYARRIAPGRR